MSGAVGIWAVLFDLGGVGLQDGDFTDRANWARQHGLSADELFAAYLAAIGPGWEGGKTEEMIHRGLLDRLGVGEDALEELLRVLHAHETLDPAITELVTDIRRAVKIGRRPSSRDARHRVHEPNRHCHPAPHHAHEQLTGA